MCGLASSAFARHYLRNHGCFLFLWVLRCFTSPRSLLLPYVFRQRSPDITPVSFEVSLFGDPRIEARLPAPRGLSQVTTSFVGSWCQGIHRLPLVACCYYKDARVHCEVLKMRAVTGRRGERRSPVRWRSVAYCDRNLRTQQRAWASAPSKSRFHSCKQEVLTTSLCEETDWSMFHIPVPTRLLLNCWRTGRMDRSFGSAKWLLRKEVIQPHLPVRLPCYDLVLIASPTFDGSLHKGWATGFGCYRLS
jgi:hypothetical protein